MNDAEFEKFMNDTQEQFTKMRALLRTARMEEKERRWLRGQQAKDAKGLDERGVK